MFLITRMEDTKDRYNEVQVGVGRGITWCKTWGHMTILGRCAITSSHPTTCAPSYKSHLNMHPLYQTYIKVQTRCVTLNLFYTN